MLVNFIPFALLCFELHLFRKSRILLCSQAAVVPLFVVLARETYIIKLYSVDVCALAQVTPPL